MTRDGMPDEANRPDGKPARKPSPEMPSPDEREAGKNKQEAAVEFVMELLRDAGVDKVVRRQFPQAEQLNISVETLARKQGRSDEFDTYFQHDGPYGQYTILTTTTAAKRLGLPTHIEEIDPDE